MAFADADENGLCTEKKDHSNGEKMAALLERQEPRLGRLFEAISRLARESELAAHERAAIISVLQNLYANTETALQMLQLHQQQLPPAMNPIPTEIRGDSSGRVIAATFAGEGAYWSIGGGESNSDSVKPQGLRSSSVLGKASPYSPRWTQSEIEALITLRSGVESGNQQFDSGRKRPSAWDEVSAGMQRLGYRRSAKKCKEKLENITKYWSKNKQHRHKNSRKLPYFDQLEALHRSKIVSKNSKGGACLLPLSIGGQQEHETRPCSNPNLDQTPDVLCPLGMIATAALSQLQVHQREVEANGGGGVVTGGGSSAGASKFSGEETSYCSTMPEESMEELILQPSSNHCSKVNDGRFQSQRANISNRETGGAADNWIPGTASCAGQALPDWDALLF